MYIRPGYTSITAHLPPEGIPLIGEFYNKVCGTTLIDIEIRCGRVFSSAPEWSVCSTGCISFPKENSTVHLVGAEVKFESFPTGELLINHWQLISWKISPAYEQKWLDKFKDEPNEDVTI